jgi:hypothetical protein
LRPVRWNKRSPPFAYGLTREEVDSGDLYVFEIDTDGTYSVSLEKARMANPSGYNKMSAIKPEVEPIDGESCWPALTFFINGEEATTIEDDTRERGAIGVALDLYNEGTRPVDTTNWLSGR